ncbi:MAG: type II toxin-antitoxin system HicB family antitoxin [bacterium]|nr:type II toxin-antitoxin system HicB family antitoxin [bacterium]
MDKRFLNYRIIIEKEKYENGLPVYVAYCPTLGISDYGKTVEKAKENMKEAIECHVQGLIKEGNEVPAPDNEEAYFSQTMISVPKNIRLAF